MNRWVIGLSAIGLSALSALAAAGAWAQDRGGPGAPFHDGPGARRGWAAMMSPDDRAAFTDARIAGLHAGLKLNPDQDKLWPAVEDAIRGWVKVRQDARQARRERMMSAQAGGPRDVPATLRFMADRQAASADALRKMADATTPLYASLDEAQKRRLAVLARGLQPGGRPQRGGMERGRMDQDGGPMRRGALGGGPRFALEAPPQR